MGKIAVIFKSLGQTPLQAVIDFKNKNPEYEKETVSYAGRLDPMAEGLLLLLIGEENKNRREYEDLSKVYETEIVFGISTDTYDALGLIENVKSKSVGMADILKATKLFKGKYLQEYPHYSSKTVKGKPLYWWARSGKINEITLPKREVEIFAIELLDYGFIYVEDLIAEVKKRVGKVSGDFRQDKILRGWEDFFENNKGKKLTKIKVRIECSGGTYIRRLAFDIAEKLETFAFCFSIIRTRIGDFTLPKGT